MTHPNEETLLEFPCRLAVKAFGPCANDFAQTVYKLVRVHAPELTMSDLSSRESRGGRYLAVTVSINARSKSQLDAIYADLTASPQVLMSL